jgi:hypothetical protein
MNQLCVVSVLVEYTYFDLYDDIYIIYIIYIYCIYIIYYICLYYIVYIIYYIYNILEHLTQSNKKCGLHLSSQFHDSRG